MDILNQIIKRAKKSPKRIVFIDNDKRVTEAIKLINKNKVAIPILLKKGNLQQKFKEAKELIINKQADAIITGINSPTKEVILFAIKNKKGLITSSELILTKNKTLLFADPSVFPFPDSKKLAEIASKSALP